ncbi:cytochrome P450 [Actinomadura sp. ATCC 31491]|uniref:Cytochrome P450 n=1 Tax=Actinomadura luzonensis TaxID=2805427 RepID=A0ABT0G1L0_9ACTN|nr:cytochrome P450 [Actinomadura luzonensis]MCK2218479.1 cytochrome P450 [Actinomadura luzonensis]
MAPDVPRATLLESLRFSAVYTLPQLARGAFIARPAMVRLLARLDTHARAQRLCLRLRTRYGGRSVLVRGPTGTVLLLLSQGDIKRVLTGADSVFSPLTKEKRTGLRLTQPDSLLLSRGRLREDRRRFNEAVLQTGRVPHDLAPRLRAVLAEELAGVCGDAPAEVDWARLYAAYDRAALRLVLGDAAREDFEILAALRALRREANWLGLRPWRGRHIRRHRRTYTAGIGRHVAAAAEGSLAGLMAAAPQTRGTCPAGQVPPWLLALDGIQAAVLGPALALLAGHPRHAAGVRAEAYDGGQELTAACVCDTLRLYPMVPTTLRTVTAPVEWHGALLPAGTEIMIPFAVHHRNPQLGYADAFTPEAWLDGRAQADWWIAPFLHGPGRCPGAELGIQFAAAALHELLRQYEFHPAGPALGPDRPLPKTLHPAALRLRARPAT